MRAPVGPCILHASFVAPKLPATAGHFAVGSQHFAGSPLGQRCSEPVQVALRHNLDHLSGKMSTQRLRQTVVRRVRLRDALKPVQTCWRFSDSLEPDWLMITHVTGPGSYETFDLQLLRGTASLCGTGCWAVSLVGWNSYETLRIAKGQAKADIGVEYVEWELCDIEITNEDGNTDWRRALPSDAQCRA